MSRLRSQNSVVPGFEGCLVARRAVAGNDESVGGMDRGMTQERRSVYCLFHEIIHERPEINREDSTSQEH